MAETGDRKWQELRVRRLNDPAAQARYERKRDTLVAVRRVLFAMEEERERRQISKAELATLAGIQPAAVRRLLTSESTNPTLRIVIGLADALGFEVELKRKSCDNKTSTLGGSRATESRARGRVGS